MLRVTWAQPGGSGEDRKLDGREAPLDPPQVCRWKQVRVQRKSKAHGSDTPSTQLPAQTFRLYLNVYCCPPRAPKLYVRGPAEPRPVFSGSEDRTKWRLAPVTSVRVCLTVEETGDRKAQD